MTSDIEILNNTKGYIAAFHSKDISKVQHFLEDNIVLIDPAGQFVGRDTVVIALNLSIQLSRLGCALYQENI